MLSDSVGKLALLHLCGTFAVFSPDSAAVYRLAVDLQPSSDFEEHVSVLPGYGPVCHRPHIQQETAVFADNVDQVADNIRRLAVLVVFRVAPGI